MIVRWELLLLASMSVNMSMKRTTMTPYVTNTVWNAFSDLDSISNVLLVSMQERAVVCANAIQLDKSDFVAERN